MAYTYEPFMPDVYAGKAFLVVPDTGNPFVVTTAAGETEIPALVEHHLNPPPQAPYPIPGPAVLDVPLEAVRANARIDAGVEAALDVAVAVKTAMQNIPDNFSTANFVATKIQLDALTEAVVAMLRAQTTSSP
jgi:hypothetical protein